MDSGGNSVTREQVNKLHYHYVVLHLLYSLPPSLHQVMEMIKQKEKLEEEIRALQEVLNTQNVGEDSII